MMYIYIYHSFKCVLNREKIYEPIFLECEKAPQRRRAPYAHAFGLYLKNKNSNAFKPYSLLPFRKQNGFKPYGLFPLRKSDGFKPYGLYTLQESNGLKFFYRAEKLFHECI